MKFTSYAQNFEDVMLWRALGDVKDGFYIDVGANDPVEDSVTKAFYDRGWHGINIEPVAAHVADLVRERTRDRNLCVAVGESAGTLELWDFGVRGWGTADAATVKMHRDAGHEAKSHQVPVETLAGLCERHTVQTIHFLKIDVEGFEASVVRGMDFERFRPWVVVIEATQPNSPQQSHHEWEGRLFDASYRLVYQDGLNRFYLANEHADRAPAFTYPPNIFDDFDIHRFVALTQALDRRLENTQSALDGTTARVEELQAHVASIETQVASANAATATANAETAAAIAEAARLAHEMQVKDARFLEQIEAERKRADNLYLALEAETENTERFRLALHAELVRYDSLVSSLSWRLTRPLRWANAQRMLLVEQGAGSRYQAVKRRLKRSLIFRSHAFLKKHPRTREHAVRLARKAGIYNRLVEFYLRNFSVLPSPNRVYAQATGLLLGQMPTARARSLLETLQQATRHSGEKL